MGRLCYPTKAPGRVLVPRASGARKLSRRAPRERSEQRGCKEGMACVFAVKVQSWLNITRVAVQTFEVIEKLSRYCYFINSTSAVSRYKLERSQK